MLLLHKILPIYQPSLSLFHIGNSLSRIISFKSTIRSPFKAVKIRKRSPFVRILVVSSEIPLRRTFTCCLFSFLSKDWTILWTLRIRHRQKNIYYHFNAWSRTSCLSSYRRLDFFPEFSILFNCCNDILSLSKSSTASLSAVWNSHAVRIPVEFVASW